jgi:NADPH:quinone reductase-like Zn-dependent oxidoreductase
MQHSRDVPFRLLTSGHNQEMMPSSAAAVEFAGPRQVRVAAVALPEPGPDEVVVTTHFSGISGGRELLAYRGEIDPGVPLDDRIESLDGTFTYPFRYGYACVGETDGQPVFAFHPHQNQFVARRDGVRPGAPSGRRGGPRRRTWIRNPSCSSTRASRPNVTSSQRTPSTRARARANSSG